MIMLDHHDSCNLINRGGYFSISWLTTQCLKNQNKNHSSHFLWLNVITSFCTISFRTTKEANRYITLNVCIMFWIVTLIAYCWSVILFAYGYFYMSYWALYCQGRCLKTEWSTFHWNLFKMCLESGLNWTCYIHMLNIHWRDETLNQKHPKRKVKHFRGMTIRIVMFWNHRFWHFHSAWSGKFVVLDGKNAILWCAMLIMDKFLVIWLIIQNLFLFVKQINFEPQSKSINGSIWMKKRWLLRSKTDVKSHFWR